MCRAGVGTRPAIFTAHRKAPVARGLSEHENESRIGREEG